MEKQKYSFEIPFYVTRFKNHAELKPKLMEAISNLEANEVTTPGSPIAQSSFGQGKLNRQWHPIFMDAAESHLVELYKELETPKWEIRQMWFQTYEPGNTHRAHTHGGYTWANVYFLNLPQPDIGTVFFHPMMHWVELRRHPQTDSPPVLRPTVQEGDIITFPGYLEHEAPVVGDDQEKTIISFNVQAVG